MVRLLGVVAALAATAAVLAVAAGCGGANVRVAEGEGNIPQGRQLFLEHCAACHTLADAGSTGTIGPDLDESYAHVIEQGFSESSIRDLVRAQIAYAVEEPPTGEPGMPRDLVTGEDAASVARYVASVAGRPAEAAPDDGEVLDAQQLFAGQCAGCHTLAAAQATGTIAPSLDEVRPGADRVLAAMREGPGAMPSFEGRLTEQQLEILADFVAENAGRQ